MADELKEIHERLQFSDEQIGALDQLISTYISKFIRIWADASTPPWHVFKVCMTEPLPVGVRAQTGQIVNEIRSCLDALASTLAIRNGRSTSSIHFPVWETKALFDQNAPKQIYKLSDKDKTAILALETHGENNPRLYGFHKFDTNRKHVRLGMTGPSQTGMSIGDCDIRIGMWEPPGRLELGKEAEIGRAILGGPSTFNFRNNLVFEDPKQILGLPVTEGLRWLRNEVGAIVTLFD